ncbi:transcription elongation factor GreA [compost metagenome]
MSKKITRLQYKRAEDKLLRVNKDIKRLGKELEEAAALGDRSENAEYDSAKAALSEARTEKARLEELLKYEIVEYDKSASITEGSIIKVSSPALKKERLLMIASTGDAIIDGVLSTDTPLGRMILGGFSGEYTVGNNIFHVEKIKNPDIDEFTKLYPEEDILIQSLFDNAGE